MIQQTRVVESFLELVKVDSESGNEEKIGLILARKFADLGWKVEIDEKCKQQTGRFGNLIIKKDGTIKEAEPILFAAHMDTVVSNKGVEPRIQEGVICTDGRTILGADDKAGIAALLEVATILKEQPIEHGPLEIVLTVEEESGLRGALFLDFSKIKAKNAFVLDSGGPVGSIVVKAPTQMDFVVHIYGKDAHAGVNPEDGINAIHVAGIALGKLEIGRIDSETTMNVGTICGGKKTNIVPSFVELKGEIRSFDSKKLEKQIKTVEEAFKTAALKKGAQIKIKWIEGFHGFAINENEFPVNVAMEAVKRAGKVPELTSRGGGSDTNVFNQKGIKAVNLGIGARNDHTNEECVMVKDLVDTAKVVLAIIEIVGQGFGD